MKLKFSGFYGDVMLTSVVEIAVLFGFFITYRLLAFFWGPDGVGVYSLIRRAIGLFQPFLFLGLGVGLSRYLAVAKDVAQRRGYLQAGGYAIFIFTLFFVVVVNLFRESFASFVFGSPSYERLVISFSMLLVGLVLHGLVYSFFRGALKVKSFNLLQIINMGLVPIIVIFVVQGKSIEVLIFTTGLWTFIGGTFFSLYFIKDIIAPVVGITRHFKELMAYSLPRFAGDMVLAGLFSFGPILAAHVMAIRDVGYLSISQSLLSSVGAVIAPLGLVLLPKVSKLMAEGRENEIKKNINLLTEAIIQCSVFLCIQMIFFSDTIVLYWLGLDFIEAVPIIRITFLALLFYCFYVAFRSILDAVKITPINTINLGIALAVFVGLSFLAISLKGFSILIGMSVAFSLALVCLGLLTYYSVRKIYPEGVDRDVAGLKTAVLINALIAGATFSVKSLIGGHIYLLIPYEAITALIYLAILYRLRVKWVTEAIRLF